jgi:hypothetical protein
MSAFIEQAVRSKYRAVATTGLSTGHSGVRAVAEAFGYTPEELASTPTGANLGLSCGNPTATANLWPGEVVVDLGCGGGLDVFLAAAEAGPTLPRRPRPCPWRRRDAVPAGRTTTACIAGCSNCCAAIT